ncbi:MAG TPA: hypothetical protein ENK00_00715 [Chromatiales bacterium]|nr:hypothetical protein [Chromatiales bacterium]
MRARGSQGQAMTEFVVTASLVLVPLFLMIPLIGKYIDMRQSAIQAARYQAWEYTAWYDRGWHASQNDRYFQGFAAYPDLPTKTPERIRAEARNRIYGRSDLPILAGDGGSWDDDRLRPLWHDHTGAPLYDGGADEVAPGPDGPQKTPKFNAVFAGVYRALSSLFSVIGGVMHALTGDGFYMMADSGHYRVDLRMAASAGPRLGDEMLLCFDAGCRKDDPLPMLAQAGLQTLGWSGGGPAAVERQQRGLLLTSLLDELNSGPVNLQGLAAGILLSPELAPDYLRFGHLVPDVVPNERVGNPAPSCEGTYCGAVP